MPLLLESIIFIVSGIFPLVKLLICSLSDDNWDDYSQESVQQSLEGDASKQTLQLCLQ